MTRIDVNGAGSVTGLANKQDKGAGFKLATDYGSVSATDASINNATLLAAIADRPEVPVRMPPGKWPISFNYTGSMPINIERSNFIQPLGSSAFTITRPFGSAINVTVDRSFQFGGQDVTGAQNLSRILTASGTGYSQFKAGQAFHISSSDLYPWFGDDGQTQHCVQAGFLTVLGIGMDVSSVTATPIVEYQMVSGQTSGSTGLVQAVMIGAGSTVKQLLFHKISGDFLVGENLLAAAGGVSGVSVGVVLGTVGSTYLLKAGERFEDDYLTNVKIRSVDQSASLRLDCSIDTEGDSDDYATASGRKDGIIIQGQYGMDVRVEVKNCYSKAILLNACYVGRVTPIVTGGLPNHTTSDAFGYGISLGPATEAISVLNPQGRYLRHLTTTNVNYTALWYASGVSDTGVTKVYGWGNPKNNTIVDGYGQDTTAAVFDVHPGAYNTTFVNPRGIAPSGGGRTASTTPQCISNRGYGTKIIGGHFKGGGFQDSAYGTPAGMFYTNEVIGTIFEDVSLFGISVPFDHTKDAVTGRHWGTLKIKGCDISANGETTPNTVQTGLRLRAGRVIVEDTRLSGFTAPIKLTADGSGGILEFTGLSVDYTGVTSPTPIQIDGTFEATFDMSVRPVAGLASLFQFLSGSTNVALIDARRLGGTALPPLYTNDAGASGQVTWRNLGSALRPVSVVGDASITLTPFSSLSSILFNSPLSATRVVTLSTAAGASASGARFRISRSLAATSITGTRYVTITDGTTTFANLAPGEWIDMKWHASVGWFVEAMSPLLTSGPPGSNGTNGLNGALGENRLTVGTETLPRQNALSRVSLTSGAVFLTYYTHQVSETVTKIRMAQDSGATAAGATPTLVKMGLYSIDPGTGDLTLIASTASDTTTFGTINSVYTKNLLAGVALTAGTRYAVAVLVTTAATVPTISGCTMLLPSFEVGSTAPVLGKRLNSQTDLPSTITAASLTDTNSMIYACVRP